MKRDKETSLISGSLITIVVVSTLLFGLGTYAVAGAVKSVLNHGHVHSFEHTHQHAHGKHGDTYHDHIHSHLAIDHEEED